MQQHVYQILSGSYDKKFDMRLNFEFSIYLNKSSSQRDDEQISTALGYAVHVLLLISKYFHVRSIQYFSFDSMLPTYHVIMLLDWTLTLYTVQKPWKRLVFTVFAPRHHSLSLECDISSSSLIGPEYKLIARWCDSR